MRIGYSFWGFLGPGIVDTPDGGRSHRRPLVDALRGRGHQLLFLQADRDQAEAGDRLDYTFDPGFPEIDALLLEWRWAIPGRNTTPCGSPGHTCDLHRQTALLEHYTVRRRLPTVIWDKDRRLPAGDAWRRHPNVAVCEAALTPTPGAARLLFPADDARLDHADPLSLAARPRPLTLVYVGNQYDRDDAFDRYFAPVAVRHRHAVAGKWTTTVRWPHVSFLGRLGFPRAMELYGAALATLLLLPQRYAEAGQMTQRIFEAVLAGCVPLCPAEVRHAERFVPSSLVVGSAAEADQKLRWLAALAGTETHIQLLAECLRRLEPFRLSTNVEALDALLHLITLDSAGIPE
ncbi:glycosyltransferase family protein [Streptomyces sp. 4N509B]|uniref:glycosyltransferase family protein n=1 Tax=Streptomyces sp. 4N509B TaxID=3457413 RepID=UPI003FD2A473